MEITNDKQHIPININEVNNVERVDKYFYYPSSFVCKFTSEGVFRTLGIHKFSHNKIQVLHTFSLSYVFHPNVMEILEQQGFASLQFENIKLAFKSLKQGQTLLINLMSPATNNNAMTNNTLLTNAPVLGNTMTHNFTVRQETPVIINYFKNKNTDSAVFYNPAFKYGGNNNSVYNPLRHLQTSVQSRSRLLRSSAVGNIPNADPDASNNNNNGEIPDVTGQGIGNGDPNLEDLLSQSKENMVIVDPLPEEQLGSPIERFVNNANAATENYSNGSPTQRIENGNKSNNGNGSPTQRIENGNIKNGHALSPLRRVGQPRTPRTPRTHRTPRTPMTPMNGGYTNKNNRHILKKVSKKIKIKHAKTKKTRKIKKA